MWIVSTTPTARARCKLTIEAHTNACVFSHDLRDALNSKWSHYFSTTLLGYLCNLKHACGVAYRLVAEQACTMHMQSIRGARSL